MVGVEEIPRGRNANTYFSSLYSTNPSGGLGQNGSGSISQPQRNRSATPNSDAILDGSGTVGGSESISGREQSSKRKRVNYNIQQIQAEQFLTSRPKSKSLSEDYENEIIDLTNSNRENNISIAELRRANRRFDELNRENYNENLRFETPKNVTGLLVKRNNNAGAVVKRLLISKKTWSNYVDELNKNELKLITNGSSPLEVKPNALQLEKLCTICGGVSYSSCIKCTARVCSIKCQNIHNETRCTHF
jgi:zinc finger HIT domain-containing protein 1